MRVTIVLFVFLLLLTFACNKNDGKFKQAITIAKIHNDSIPLDSMTSPEGNDICFHEDKNNNILVYLINRKTNSLYIYDWLSKKQLSKLSFQVEGPSGVGNVNYVYAKSRDSIFLLSNYQYKLTLINSKGNILRKFTLLPDGSKFDESTLQAPSGSYSILPTGGWQSPIIETNNVIYLCGFPNLNPMQKDFYSVGKVSLALNLKTGKVTYFKGYPDSYKEKAALPMQSLSPFWVHNAYNGSIIYSFPDDHNISIYNLSSGATVSKKVISDKFKANNQLFKRSNNPFDELNYFMSTSHYDRIIYDKYRKIYYRFVKINKYKTYNNSLRFPFDYRIIVVDSNFVKKGEIESSVEYDHGYFFVSKDGLYLQENNPQNEDFLYFSLFKLN